jgi:hypothetical protein
VAVRHCGAKQPALQSRGAAARRSEAMPGGLARRLRRRPSDGALRPSRSSYETFRCPGPNRKSSSASADPAPLQPWQSSETAKTRGSRRRSAPLNRPHASRSQGGANRSRAPAVKFRRLENRHWRPGAQNRRDPPGSVGLQFPRPQRPAECGALRRIWRSLPIPTMRGWGGRIRTSGWRNQNPLPYHLATPQCVARLERPWRKAGGQ